MQRAASSCAPLQQFQYSLKLHYLFILQGGFSPVFAAVQSNNMGCVELLIERGDADLNQQRMVSCVCLSVADDAFIREDKNVS